MSIENQVCKLCGKHYHYCGSCSPTPYYENGYCSEECMSNYTYDTFKLYEEYPCIITKSVFKCLTKDNLYVIKYNSKYIGYDIENNKLYELSLDINDIWLRIYIEEGDVNE